MTHEKQLDDLRLARCIGSGECRNPRTFSNAIARGNIRIRYPPGDNVIYRVNKATGELTARQFGAECFAGQQPSSDYGIVAEKIKWSPKKGPHTFCVACPHCVCCYSNQYPTTQGCKCWNGSYYVDPPCPKSPDGIYHCSCP